MATKETKENLTENTQEAKKKALAKCMADIEKSFGKGAVMKMGDKPDMNIESIPSGSISLDMVLGNGGYPKGRIIEVFGPESSGKSTLALQAVAECQSRGGTAAYIDAEHAMDPSYAEAIGVNIDEMLISQPDSGEQALEITERLIRSGCVDIIVIDSVAALVPKAELEGEMGDNHVGLQSRLMSQALRKLTAVTSNTNCLVIFINQLREKVGVMFGNPETTPGGRALKFYSSVRLDVRKVESIKNKNGEFSGNIVKVKAVKNKVAPPFKEAKFEIVFGKGISKSGDILDVAVSQDIVVKSGSWYSYNDEKIGQGRDATKAWLEEHPDMMQEIYDKIMDKLQKKADHSEDVPVEEEEPFAD